MRFFEYEGVRYNFAAIRSIGRIDNTAAKATEISWIGQAKPQVFMLTDQEHDAIEKVFTQYFHVHKIGG